MRNKIKLILQEILGNTYFQFAAFDMTIQVRWVQHQVIFFLQDEADSNRPVS